MKIAAHIRYILFAVMLFTVQTSVWGQTTQVSSLSKITYPNSSTFTVPAGVYALTLETWGAGGGGGKATSAGRGSAGGGGGAYAKSIISVTPGETLIITIGSGGGSDTNGGASFITQGGVEKVKAAGGSAGQTNGTAGGAGGQDSNCTFNVIAYNGGKGGDGYSSTGASAQGGGGGGAAGSTGVGKPGSNGGNNGGALGSNVSGGGTTEEYGGAGGTGTGNNGNGGDAPSTAGYYGGGGGGAKCPSLGGTDRNGGSGRSGFARISFPTPPVITLTGPTTVCEGEEITLTATSPHPARSVNGWEWIGNGIIPGTYTNSSSFSTENLPAGSYTYKVRVHYGDITWQGSNRPSLFDESLNTVSFTVIPKPTLVLTSGTQNQTVCEGTAIVVTTYTFGGSATGANVSVPAGMTYSVSAPTVIISGTPTASGNYIITTSGGSCGTATIKGDITVNLKPTLTLASANANATICQGASISSIVYTLGGSATGANVSVPAGMNYSVSPPTVTISGTPTASGTYTITTTGGSCPPGAIATGTITVESLPNVGDFTLADTIYCLGSNLVFPSDPNATSNGTPITDPTKKGWLLGGTPVTHPYQLTIADNGKTLRYYAENGCGISYSNAVTIHVIVPEIISITPNSGPITGGIYTDDPLSPINPLGIVTIKGYGFEPIGTSVPITVIFGGNTATNVTIVDDNTITCTPPASISPGNVTVSVIVDCGIAILTDGYSYEAMNITKVDPNYAPVTGGDTITIDGAGLWAAGVPVGDVWVKLCGVEATVHSVTNDQIVCIAEPSDFAMLGSIEIFNGVESRVFPKLFTYYPVNFIKKGSWSEAYNWEKQTDDRIFPYPGAVVHINANCLQDVDLKSGTPYLVRQRDSLFFPDGNMDSITVYPSKGYTVDNNKELDANVFTLKDNASFLNFGTMSASQQNVEHSLVKERNWYVSSPVMSATTAALDSGTLGNDLTILGTVNTSSATVPSDWRVEKYFEQNHEWQRLQTNNSLTLGEGYTVYSKNEDIAVKFSGTYNNSDFTLPAGWLTRQNDAHVKRGFNLVGNPFPSYWRWTETAASGAKVYSTIWYRTVTADSCYEFWSYNAAGNVAVAPGWNNGTPSGEYSLSYIPPMQAFWVRVRDGETPGLLTFSNDHRSHADHPSNMLRSAARTDNGEQRKLRIALSGSKNTDEILIYTNNNAQPGFDDYDSDKMFTDVGAELFTLSGSQNRELVINGLPKISDGMEIKLGIKADEGGSFKLQAKEMLNMEPFDTYLRDSWRKTEHKLSAESPYQYTAGSEYNTDRFSIVFRNSGSTNNDAIINNDNSYFRAYSNKEGQIVILNNSTENCDVAVYDILGNNITIQNVVSKTQTVLNGNFKKGIYILRAGKYTTKVAVQR